MRVTTKPNRSETGYSIRLGGKAVAWVAESGRAKISRRYRAELGNKPIPEEVRAAIKRAKAKLQKEA